MLRRTFLLVGASFLSLTQISCNGGTSAPATSPAQLTTRSDIESDLVSQRFESIRREVQLLNYHDWAGAYYAGDGLGANTRLELAPANGAAVTCSGCLGMYDQNYGPVHEAEGHIKVTWTIQNPDSLPMSAEYLPIRWGPRHYLVPPEDVLEFCLAARTGREPRKQARGLFLLRVGDAEQPVEGSPELPARFEKYWSMKSIKANFETVGAAVVQDARQDATLDKVTHQVTLNVGAVEGVLPRMQFKITKPRLGARVAVVKVNEHKSNAVLTFYRSKGDNAVLPSQAWELSTPVW